MTSQVQIVTCIWNRMKEKLRMFLRFSRSWSFLSTLPDFCISMTDENRYRFLRAGMRFKISLTKTATLQPLSATSSKSQTTTKQKMDLQNCQNCTFQFSSWKKSGGKSVKSCISFLSSDPLKWLVSLSMFLDEDPHRNAWYFSDVFTWLKNNDGPKRRWKTDENRKGCWNRGEIYDHRIIYLMCDYAAQDHEPAHGIILKYHAKKPSTRLSCRRDQKCGACVPTASVFQRKVTGHCIFMCLPHIATWPGLVWSFLMTGTVTSVSTYQSLSSRPVRNRAFIFILRMAITFNDPSKVSEGLERTDTLQMLLAESWKVYFLWFAWTVRIKIGNIQQNRQMSDQSKTSTNSGHIILLGSHSPWTTRDGIKKDVMLHLPRCPKKLREKGESSAYSSRIANWWGHRSIRWILGRTSWLVWLQTSC